MIKVLKQTDFSGKEIFFGAGDEFYNDEFSISVNNENLSFNSNDFQGTVLKLENCLVDQESVMKIMNVGMLRINEVDVLAGNNLIIRYVIVKNSLHNYLLVIGIREFAVDNYRLYVLQVWECAYYA